jgi:outer membrane cobalamin receptor
MRVQVRPLFLSLFLSLACIVNAAAGPVTGRVVDPDGRAVRGATVLLVDGTAVVATTVTDESGNFTLAAPREGSFDLHVSADGFRATPHPVRGEGNVGAIALAVSAVRESVVVSAAQVDIPLSTTSSSVTVLTAAHLEAIQARDLADALRLVPGVTIAAAGGMGVQTSVFPRGGESDYSLVFIDGVQANAFGGGFDFGHVPLTNVERIEIVRGPQSALYGSNAIGSVIRVVTKRGGAPSAAALIEGGNFGTSHFAGSGSGSSGSLQWGGFLDRVSSDGSVPNDDYERWSIAGGAGWSRAAGAAVRADVHYTNDERGFPGPYGSDPGGTFEGLDTISRGSNDRWLASVSGGVPAGSRVRLNGQFAVSRIDGEQVSSFDPESPSTITSRRTQGRAQADLTMAPALQASIGGEFGRERAGSTFITAEGSREIPVERTLAGAFAEVRWNRQSRLFVTAGVRAERIARDALAGSPDAFVPRPDFAEDVVTSVNPKVGVAWFVRSDAGSFTKIRGSVGTGIRPPDAFEVAFTDNPSLKPERSRSVDGGIDQAFAGGRASVEATAFYNHYDDLIIAVGSFGNSSRYRTDNISNARTRGMEFSGAVRARAFGGRRAAVDLDLRIAVTLLDTEILAVDGDADAPPPFEPGDRLLRRPAVQTSVELTMKGRRFSGFVTAGGRSRTRDVDPSFGTFGGLFDSPGFAVINAGAAWRVARQLEVFGKITNLFDRDYEEALGFPALGRAAIGGLRVAAGR